jgi:phenylacetate-CoA ligase
MRDRRLPGLRYHFIRATRNDELHFRTLLFSMTDVKQVVEAPTLERLWEMAPTAGAASRAKIAALFAHASAPRWTHAAGDRLTAADVERLTDFGARLAKRRGTRAQAPSEEILAWTASRIAATPLFRRRIAASFDIARRWVELPTSAREDLAASAEYLVPDDVPLERMILYRTAGTTGHALTVPQDALAVACYLPLISYALERYGVDTRFVPDDTACFLVGSQRQTVTYPTALAGWGGAGFAKLNLFADEWPSRAARNEYFAHFAPRFLTGDPLSFSDMLEAGIDLRPAALVSTAVAMSQGLKRRLESAYACPVIDWYSLTETGPLGYGCTQGHGYHWLPHDVHLEALDTDGRSTEERGEIAVTGGRNPYLPLLRYRTGDWGRIDFAPCPCGDPMPRLMELEGRAPVRFRNARGETVAAQDVATVLRRFPLVQSSFEQDAAGACTLVYRALGLPLVLRDDPQLGRRGPSDKVVPFSTKMLEE